MTEASLHVSVGTTIGVAIVDVRSRDVASAVAFAAGAGGCFASSLSVSASSSLGPSGRPAFLACCARFVSPGELPGRRERTAAFTVRVAEADGKADVADLVSRQDLTEEEEEEDSVLSAVAKIPPSKKSLLNPQNFKSPPSDGKVYSTPYSGLGMKSRAMAQRQRQRGVRSSGYGRDPPRRTMFTPTINHKKSGTGRKGRQFNLGSKGVGEWSENSSAANSRPRWATRTGREEALKGAGQGEEDKGAFGGQLVPDRFLSAVKVWSTDGAKTR